MNQDINEKLIQQALQYGFVENWIIFIVGIIAMLICLSVPIIMALRSEPISDDVSLMLTIIFLTFGLIFLIAIPTGGMNLIMLYNAPDLYLTKVLSCLLI